MNIPYKQQFKFFAVVMAFALSVWLFDLCLYLMNEPDTYKLFFGGAGALVLILIWVTVSAEQVKKLITWLWAKLNKNKKGETQ